jgi:hypothetical protein
METQKMFIPKNPKMKSYSVYDLLLLARKQFSNILSVSVEDKGYIFQLTIKTI